MNIVLIGYRGTGKSTVGKIISEKLRIPLVVMDDRIIELEGTSIPDIVAHHGWDYFRDIETRVAREISDRDNIVVDTGGGVILRSENIAYLKRNGILFWLKSAPEIIAGRIKDSGNRPSLTGKKSFLEEIQEVLLERFPKYESAADYAVDTDNFTPPQVADEIIRTMADKGAGSD